MNAVSNALGAALTHLMEAEALGERNAFAATLRVVLLFTQ